MLVKIKIYVIIALIIAFTSCDTKKKPSYSSDTSIQNSVECLSTITYGSRPICLVEIEGMTECSSHPIVSELIEPMLQPIELLFGVYIKNEEYSKIDGQDSAAIQDTTLFNEYYKVHGLETAKSLEVSDIVLDQYADLIKNALTSNYQVKDMLEDVGLDVPVHIETYSPHERIRSIVFCWKDATSSSFVVASGLEANNRLVSISYNKEYYNDYDISKAISDAKSMSDKFTLDFILAN